MVAASVGHGGADDAVASLIACSAGAIKVQECAPYWFPSRQPGERLLQRIFSWNAKGRGDNRDDDQFGGRHSVPAIDD